MIHNHHGSKNPNWHGGKVALSCRECGRKFEVIPSRATKAGWCSLKCWNVFQSRNPAVPVNKGVRAGTGGRLIAKSCRRCGDEFVVRFFQRNAKHLCSKACRVSEHRERIAGEKHPSYRHGGKRVCEQCGKHFVRRAPVRFCSRACATPSIVAARLNDGLPRKTTQSRRIRSSDEYAAWRTSVFKRDDFTCQKCKRRGDGMTAHHLKPFATHPELRLEISNGITLCWNPCHREIHNK